MTSDTARWLEQAREDLDTAEANRQIKKYYASAFFSQQCAEKALKAVYMKKFDDLAKVHDLNFLGQKVGVPIQLLEGCRRLSRAYIESRYPGELKNPAQKFSGKEADECIEIAEEVFKWAKKMV